MSDSAAGDLVIAIVGPTAVGKTAVAVALSELLGGRAAILSADSVQVYRRLDIGSSKPTAQERSRAAFRLIDLVDPDQDFTLSDFQEAATAAHLEAQSQAQVSLLVGGTGLYVRALTQAMNLPHVPPNAALREEWQAYAARNGAPALHQIVTERDPETASRLHVGDVKRQIRALEVLAATGRRLSDWHRDDRMSGLAILGNVALFGLNREREHLYHAIDERVNAMMAAGFLDEVAALRRDGYVRHLKPMQSLGYKELNAVVDGEITLREAVDLVKRHTRQFARRQLIWFRADERIHWIDVEGIAPSDAAMAIYSRIESQFLSIGA